MSIAENVRLISSKPMSSLSRKKQIRFAPLWNSSPTRCRLGRTPRTKHPDREILLVLKTPRCIEPSSRREPWWSRRRWKRTGGDAVDRGGGAAGEREARDTRRHHPPGPSVAAVAVAAALLNQRRELSAGIRRRVHRAHVRKQLDHGGCEGERGRGKRSHSGGVTLEVRNRVGRAGDSKKIVDATTERGWFATRVGSNGGFITTRVASGGGRTSGSGRWVRRPDDRARAMRGARARRQYGRRSCTTIPYTRSDETGRADNSSTVLAM